MSGGFLAVDGGNTRLKATYFPAEWTTDAEVRCFGHDGVDALMDWVDELRQHGPMGGALAVVGKVDVRLAESLRQAFDGNFLIMTPATDLPVKIGYRTPLTLGLDRKATACAAAWRFPGQGVLVVDAGTALTIDLVTPAGEFAGGNISPGLRLRFRSLHAFTAALPLIEEVGEDLPDFGFDTESAICAGVAGGWADEVIGCILRAAGAGVRKVILTGGDAALLMRMLRQRPETIGQAGEITIEHYPHLLAEGRRTIYRHHENEN